VGLKNVFDRLKGKSSESQNSGANREELTRRHTDEETIQVNAAAPRAGTPPAVAGQESATAVAPRSDRPMPKAPPQPSGSAPALRSPARDTARHDEQATVAASSSPPPAVATPAARPAVPSSPRQRLSATPVAPNPNRRPTPSPALAAAPPARPNPSAPSVSSDDETLYQKPSGDESLEIAGVLVGIFGAVKNRVFTVPRGSTTIGRADDCAVQLLDAKVSREHATIRCEDGVLEIARLNDRNPLLVNDEPIEGPHPLSDGDKLQFGNAGASVLRLRTVDGL